MHEHCRSVSVVSTHRELLRNSCNLNMRCARGCCYAAGWFRKQNISSGHSSSYTLHVRSNVLYRRSAAHVDYVILRWFTTEPNERASPANQMILCNTKTTYTQFYYNTHSGPSAVQTCEDRFVPITVSQHSKHQSTCKCARCHVKGAINATIIIDSQWFDNYR